MDEKLQQANRRTRTGTISFRFWAILLIVAGIAAAIKFIACLCRSVRSVDMLLDESSPD